MESVSQDSEISAKKVLLGLISWYKHLLSKWKTIVVVALIFSALGFLYSWITPPVYSAEYTFVLEDDGKGGGSDYAGLASMLGIYQGGTSGGGLFVSDNIIDLYESRRMIEKTLLTQVTYKGASDLLVNRYMAVTGLREKLKKDTSIKFERFKLPQEAFTRQQDSILGMIADDMGEHWMDIGKRNNRENIISVRVRSVDELFTKQFADNLVENVNTFFRQTKTKKSTANLQILKSQADSLRKVLNNSMSGAVASIDANPNANLALQSLKLPSQKKQIDIQSTAGIYAEIVKNLELSSIALRKETPLIQVIDSPTLPLKKDIKRKPKYIIGFAFIGAFLTALFLLCKKLIADILN